ncbi:efflux RND transporter periplasmic adaptor subunit [Paraflavitalea sp. CAU 1676]|uniref:efflux RND transporter periplasmic adaptor subunit n=1 Tax=Paraflavitalea sp. CAU 1676 TaxID=3032598 RepID=UPI0023DCB19C|nr:efflux RND transporter periplasmic adaptor subunit [Paraflavitalea sp. CAU 1676]MDF2191320.1 efflux RND transporter periplasmic adaptor subunit [Paraflavitalea sp. CAU 1676]
MKTIQGMKFSIIVFAAISLFASCGSSGKPSNIESKEEEKYEEEGSEVILTEAQFKTAGISFGVIESKQISGTFKANGVLDVPPQNKVSISVAMGGFLKQTSLLEGKRVRKGEMIAVIENPEYVGMQQDYLEAKSQLEYAKADYGRQQELGKENINAQKTLQQSKASFQTLSAKVNGLKEKIKVSGLSLTAVENGNIQSSINIYSPINGFVTEINANIGKFVNPTDVLFEIVDTEHLHAELTVFEKDVPKLEIGQKVRFTLANETTERIAKVYLIGREIGADRTVRIHCHIEKEDIHLLPGMYLKAVVETGQMQVPALPDEAIVDYQGQKYIFVASDRKEKTDTINRKEGGESEYHFEMIAIQLGNSDVGYAEVILPEGVDKAKIVVKGAYSLLSKMKNSEEEGEHH